MKGITYYIDFYIGDYQGKLNPFTLMPVKDRWLKGYESDIFALRRFDNKSELYLIDDTWLLYVNISVTFSNFSNGVI